MIVVNSRGELKNLINRRIEERGPNCDLNDIDVSRSKEPEWYKHLGDPKGFSIDLK